MSKLTIVNVAELWQNVSVPNAHINELLVNIDDMDMAGFQLMHRLVCSGRISLSQLDPSIAKTLQMMGCKDDPSSVAQYVLNAHINPVENISANDVNTDSDEIRKIDDVVIQATEIIEQAAEVIAQVEEAISTQEVATSDETVTETETVNETTSELNDSANEVETLESVEETSPELNDSVDEVEAIEESFPELHDSVDEVETLEAIEETSADEVKTLEVVEETSPELNDSADEVKTLEAVEETSPELHDSADEVKTLEAVEETSPELHDSLDEVETLEVVDETSPELNDSTDEVETLEVVSIEQTEQIADALTQEEKKDVIHDLSWREIRHTIMTMNLAVAQIDLSMNEGEYSVDTLIDSFGFMNAEIDRVNNMLQGETVDLEQIRSTLSLQNAQLTQKAEASIVAFQFYDKLSQRLHHVSQSLSALTDIISCGDCVIDEQNWDKFMDRMSKYACMKEESELFELIFERGYGATTAVAMIREILSNKIEQAREKHKNDAPDFEDDIELF